MKEVLVFIAILILCNLCVWAGRRSASTSIAEFEIQKIYEACPNGFKDVKVSRSHMIITCSDTLKATIKRQP